MQIDLIRHGEYEGEKAYCGSTDRKLSEKGWQQMSAACDCHNSWEQIISSPLSRCTAFAKQLSDNLQIPLTIDGRWREMHFGRWDGFTALDIMQNDEQALTDFWKNPVKYSPPEGETLQQVVSRILVAWNELKQYAKPSLVVTHGGPMRIIHCHEKNHPLEQLMEIQVQNAELHSYLLNKELAK